MLCPHTREEGLNILRNSYEFRPFTIEDPSGLSYSLAHYPISSLSFYKDWLYYIRPSILVFKRKGNTTFLEPYYPHHFSRNFSYDQLVSPNADFALEGRVCRNHDTHLVTGSWQDFFFKSVPHKIPKRRRVGQVDIYYACWWFKHRNVFRQPPQKLRKPVQRGQIYPYLLLRIPFFMPSFHRLKGLLEISVHSKRQKMGTSPQIGVLIKG